MKSRLSAAAALLAVIALFAVLRIRTIDVPLERDEGEYAYAGQLLLQGVPPYTLAYNMKWPGTYAAYAVMLALFGESIRGIRVGILLVTTLTAVGVYLLGSRSFGRIGGLAAAAAQLLFSVSVASLGLFGHATHFVALFAVFGFLLLDEERPWKLFLSGVLLASAALMKQPGAAFGLAAVVYLGWSRRWRNSLYVIAGAAVAVAACFGALAMAGVFQRFWFWTIDYSRAYTSQIPWAIGLGELKRNFGLIVLAAPALWLVSAAGTLLLPSSARARVVLFGLAGILAVVPGLYFREHYFITLFPAAALCAGAAVASMTQRLRTIARQASFAPAAVFVLIVIAGFVNEWRELRDPNPERMARKIYMMNPFPESLAIAKYIRARTGAQETIAVLGSEPQIYFYSGRRSATGYIYTYPLMEEHEFAHQMQLEMIREIERSRPKYMVLVNVYPSWLQRPGSDLTITDWMWSNPGNAWTLDGVVDIFKERTDYVWGPTAARHQPRSKDFVFVLRRRES